ncbi:MAG: Xaa-Pro peptidase family protein [Pseudomonadota bacterium]
MIKETVSPSGITYKEYDRRWSSALERLRALNADALIVTNSTHIDYLIGHDARGADMAPFFVIVAPNTPRTLICRGMEAVSVEAEAIPVDMYTYFSGVEDAIPLWAETLKRLGFKKAKIALELDTWGLCHKDVTDLQGLLPTIDIVDGTSVIAEAIDIKSAEEISHIRRCIGYTDLMFDTWFQSLRLGISEYESQARVLSTLETITSDDVEVLRHETNTLFGKRTRLPHGNASKRNFLNTGDIATFEAAPFVHGYAAGYCRTAIFQGRHKKAEELHALSDEAVQTGIDIVKPGVSAGLVDEAIRGVLVKAGRTSCYRHRSGYSHGFHWNHRGGISLRPGASKLIEKDMVLFLTCFLYDESGDFGVVTSDPVLVTQNGCEVLTKSSRDIRFI